MGDVIEYVHEWELVVKTRVDASQKQIKELKKELDHYEKKVESLTRNHEAVIEKGKEARPKDVDQIKRNEEKLALARDTYESKATDLCNMLEEIVDCAWKDLLPLLLRMMKMESGVLEDMKSIVDSSNVIQNLKNLAEEYKIDVTTPAPSVAEAKASPPPPPTAAAAGTKKVSPVNQ